MKQKIITRFPPSPTGPIHIGNVRTALFNYLYAKHHGGQFILRIEDTDKARSKPEFEEGILESLSWLGLRHDNEIFRQSERGAVYKKYLDKLIAEDKAYISLEDEGENREVIRFRNPNQKIVFEDLVRGEVSFDTTELGDFIIARNKDEPLYHLAVVIDDFESGVTHVIRGEDHVSNTPRQILIQEALGAPRPIYAHLPLILASDRSKLSKRKHGESVSLDYYRKKGYLAEALINYLALLGWNPGTNEEIFTLEKLVKVFDIAKIQKGGAVFDPSAIIRDSVSAISVGLLDDVELLDLAYVEDKDAEVDMNLVLTGGGSQLGGLLSLRCGRRAALAGGDQSIEDRQVHEFRMVDVEMLLRPVDEGGELVPRVDIGPDQLTRSRDEGPSLPVGLVAFLDFSHQRGAVKDQA